MFEKFVVIKGHFVGHVWGNTEVGLFSQRNLKRLVYVLADFGNQDWQTLNFCILESGIRQKFQSYWHWYCLNGILTIFQRLNNVWHLNLTSNRVTNFTNLIHCRHFRVEIIRQEHWYWRRFWPIWKKKSIKTIGEKRNELERKSEIIPLQNPWAEKVWLIRITLHSTTLAGLITQTLSNSFHYLNQSLLRWMTRKECRSCPFWTPGLPDRVLSNHPY